MKFTVYPPQATSAIEVTNTPAGNISATNVQDAINELDTEKAALAGADFTGAVTHIAPTAATNPARLRDVSLYTTETSASTVDVFGSAGTTVGIDNTTPVTTIDFTDCTAAQVGSVKRVIPAQDWTITASANMTYDGASAGDFVIPAGARIEVLAKTTSTFEILSVSGVCHCVDVYATGTTSITSTYNQVSLAGVVYDPDSAFASSRFTAKVAGDYIVSGGIYFASGSYAVIGQIRKTGTSILNMGPESPAVRVVSGSTSVYLAVDDYLELWGYSATTQNASASASATYLRAILVTRR